MRRPGRTRTSCALETVARFPNGPVEHADGLHWDVPGLHQRGLAGLAAAGPVGQHRRGLVGRRLRPARDGRPARPPVVLPRPAQRGGRRRGARAGSRRGPLRPHRRAVPAVQHRLPARADSRLAGRRPDAARARPADVLADRQARASARTPRRPACSTCAPATGTPSSGAGRPRPRAARRRWSTRHAVGRLACVHGVERRLPVVAVGSHDTASAVVGVPMTEPDAAYISCGTWGLVGRRARPPVLTEASRARTSPTRAGSTAGPVPHQRDGHLAAVRDAARPWGGERPGGLARAAAAYDGAGARLRRRRTRASCRPDEHSDMPARIAELVPRARPSRARRPGRRSCAASSDSLAEAFAAAVERAAELSGRDVRRVHVVGGGAQNTLLCRLLADRCGLPVLAGPVEATALGNVLVQVARSAIGLVGGLEDLRSLVARTRPTRPPPTATRTESTPDEAPDAQAPRPARRC